MGALRFSLLHEMEVRGRTPEDEQKMFDDVLSQIVLGDELGYECVWIAEHHFAKGFSHASAPDLVLAAASRVTKRIRLGLGVVLLPFNHPARTAERVATLDQLSGGRVEFGTGRGASPQEYQAFGVPFEQSRDLWSENLDLVKAIWAADTADLTLDHPRWGLPGVNCFPRPVQRPHPPVWVATVSTDGCAAAGKHGLNLLCLPTLKGLSGVSEDIAVYKTELEASGFDPENHKIGMLVPWHIAETRQEAIDLVATQAIWYMRRLVNIVSSPDWAAARDGYKVKGHMVASMPQEECLEVVREERMMVLDDVEGSRQAIKDFEAAGVTDLLCQFRVGGASNEIVSDSMRRFAATFMEGGQS